MMCYYRTSQIENTWRACKVTFAFALSVYLAILLRLGIYSEIRTQAVKTFLEIVCPHIQHDLPALQDVYGPTSTDPDVQGIIFSEESRKGAVSGRSLCYTLPGRHFKLIQLYFSVAEIRKDRNLSTLETFVINVIGPDVVIDTDTVGKEAMLKAKMGSTHIRRRLRERAEQEKAAEKASSTN